MVWVLCWSGVACGGMPARDRADAAAVRDAWADGGPAAGVLAGVRRAVPGRWSAFVCWRSLWLVAKAWGATCVAVVGGCVWPGVADKVELCAAVRDAGGAESASKRINVRSPVRGSIVSIERIAPVLCADGACAGTSSSSSATAVGTGLLGWGVTTCRDAVIGVCWGTCASGGVGVAADRPRAARCVWRTGSDS